MKIVMKLINLRANKNQALTRNEKPLERGGGCRWSITYRSIWIWSSLISALVLDTAISDILDLEFSKPYYFLNVIAIT